MTYLEKVGRWSLLILVCVINKARPGTGMGRKRQGVVVARCKRKELFRVTYGDRGRRGPDPMNHEPECKQTDNGIIVQYVAHHVSISTV